MKFSQENTIIIVFLVNRLAFSTKAHFHSSLTYGFSAVKSLLEAFTSNKVSFFQNATHIRNHTIEDMQFSEACQVLYINICYLSIKFDGHLEEHTYEVDIIDFQ